MDNHMPDASGIVVDAAPEPELLWQRLIAAWLRFSGPNPKAFRASLEDQERLRRSRVLSGFLLLIIIALFLIIPTAILVPTYWIATSTFFALSLFSFFCNRAALINLGGLWIICAIDIALVILMVTLPHGIRNSNIPDFDLLLISTLIGGMVLPRRILPFIILFHIILAFTLFTLLPHDRLLTEEIRINQDGSPYGELSDVLILQIVGGTLAWLNARSVDLALLRASKAEELAATQRSLHEQASLQGEQMKRLEYGIEVLKEAHARFANGDYRARAVLQDNELASLAISFNLLADRINRIAREAKEQEHIELAFQQLFALQEEVVYSGHLRPLMPTGTLVDKIYPWLRQYFLFRQVYNRCGAIIEKARLAFTRQRAMLAQLQAIFDQMRVELRMTNADARRLAPVYELLERARNLCGQAEEQGNFGFQETKQLDQMLKM